MTSMPTGFSMVASLSCMFTALILTYVIAMGRMVHRSGITVPIFLSMLRGAPVVHVFSVLIRALGMLRMASMAAMIHTRIKIGKGFCWSWNLLTHTYPG